MFKPKPFAGQRLVQFTQQLATLLGAGQPLDRALTILLELPEDEAAKRTINDVRDAVRGGTALSTALERQHGTFSRLYITCACRRAVARCTRPCRGWPTTSSAAARYAGG